MARPARPVATGVSEMIPLYQRLKSPPRRMSAVERRFADWDTLLREWCHVELHRQLKRRGLTVEQVCEKLREHGPDVLLPRRRAYRPGERTEREKRIAEQAYRQGLSDAYAKQRQDQVKEAA